MFGHCIADTLILAKNHQHLWQLVSATILKKMSRVLVSYRSSIGWCWIEGSTTMLMDTPSIRHKIQKLLWVYFFSCPWEKQNLSVRWRAYPKTGRSWSLHCIQDCPCIRQLKMMLIKFWFSYIVLFHQNSKLISTQFFLVNIRVDKNFSCFSPTVSADNF